MPRIENAGDVAEPGVQQALEFVVAQKIVGQWTVFGAELFRSWLRLFWMACYVEPLVVRGALKRRQACCDGVVRPRLDFHPVGRVRVHQMDGGTVEQAIHVLRLAGVAAQQTVLTKLPQVARLCDRFIRWVRDSIGVSLACIGPGVQKPHQFLGREARLAQIEVHLRLTEAFAAHLQHVGRVYRRDRHQRVVLIIDNAPWRAGDRVDAALRDNPHLELKRLPAYSPQLNPIERLWRVLRRRATHNRLFDTLADLKRSVRNSLCYFQTVRSRVASLVKKSFRQKVTASLAS